LSTNFPERLVDPDEWVSQAEAARLRGVSRQAIARLVKRGRLTTLHVGGHTLVKKAEILDFQPRSAGRPKQDESA
jgi:excisionase family DNA binding protein